MRYFASVAAGALIIAVAVLGALVVPWNAVASWLASNSALANVLLTGVLVGVTALYAMVTAGTLQEMRAARGASIRPILKFRLAEMTMHPEASSSEPMLRIEGQLKVANLGRGIAIDVRPVLICPWSRSGEETRFLESHISDSIESLDPSGEKILSIRTLVLPYELSEPEKGFFELRSSFEDVEAGLYETRQFYNIHPIAGLEPGHLDLNCSLGLEQLRRVTTDSVFRRRLGFRSNRDREQLLMQRR